MLRKPLGLKAEFPRMNAGAPTPDINGANCYGLAPSECFEGTSFSRFSLSQNVRLLGGSNQGRMKSDEHTYSDRNAISSKCNSLGHCFPVIWLQSNLPSRILVRSVR